MAAGEENGQTAEPEAAVEPEAAGEESRSFKDLVRPAWSWFYPRCSLPRPEEHHSAHPHTRPGVGRTSHSAVCRAVPHAAPPCLYPRGAALGCDPGPVGAAGARGQAGTSLLRPAGVRLSWAGGPGR